MGKQSDQNTVAGIVPQDIDWAWYGKTCMSFGREVAQHSQLLVGSCVRRGEVLESSRRRVGELLWIIGLSRVTAPMWEMLRGGRAIRQSRRMQEFYSSLLPDGALVFDVGANVGTMTRVFSSLGARILAVEPNPDCVRRIELTTS